MRDTWKTERVGLYNSHATALNGEERGVPVELQQQRALAAWDYGVWPHRSIATWAFMRIFYTASAARADSRSHWLWRQALALARSNRKKRYTWLAPEEIPI